MVPLVATRGKTVRNGWKRTHTWNVTIIMFPFAESGYHLTLGEVCHENVTVGTSSRRRKQQVKNKGTMDRFLSSTCVVWDGTDVLLEHEEEKSNTQGLKENDRTHKFGPNLIVRLPCETTHFWMDSTNENSKMWPLYWHTSRHKFAYNIRQGCVFAREGSHIANAWLGSCCHHLLLRCQSRKSRHQCHIN